MNHFNEVPLTAETLSKISQSVQETALLEKDAWRLPCLNLRQELEEALIFGAN